MFPTNVVSELCISPPVSFSKHPFYKLPELSNKHSGVVLFLPMWLDVDKIRYDELYWKESNQ